MLVALNDVEFAYAAETIFTEVNLKINERDTIGLIGCNGVGKTTLLRVILGELTPSLGTVLKKGGLNIGYLSQGSGISSEKTVYAEMEDIFADVNNAIAKISRLAVGLSEVQHDSEEYKRLISDYDTLEKRIIASDGYNISVKIKTVLNGMGFIDFYDRKISTMSGGEKTRLALCSLLLKEPELLILDEPTNHLDFKTLDWLQGYLATYKGAILIVSHDRYFLDKTVKHIWEIEDKHIDSYNGNYTKYKTTKQELVLSRTREYEKQRLQIAKMREYAEKNIVRATTAKSAKSRLALIDNMTILTKPRQYTKPPHFKFRIDMPSGKEVLALNIEPLEIGGKRLIDKADFTVKSGERIAIIGDNGTGKSTLIRSIVNAFQAQNEGIRFGKDVTLGYYDQENLNINFENTLFSEMWDKYYRKGKTYVRSILGALLFTNDDMDKKISTLSGGERAKLGFALIMADNPNTLILDEPTNHLDLMTREALEDALGEFEGTLIFVSHDRYFLDRIATRILAIENNSLAEYEGNFSYYAEQKQIAARRITEELERQKLEQLAEKKPQQKSSYRSQTERALDTKRRMAISALEKKIAALEQQQQALQSELLLPEVLSNYTLYKKTNDELEAVTKELDLAMEEWISLT